MERERSITFDLDPVVSEKPELTDDGQTTDACATTVALLTKSSRAKTNYGIAEVTHF